MADAKQKSLVIVESPAKAKTIGRFLGSDFQVESSYGHVRDLPQNAKEIPTKLRSESWSRLGVNVENGFEPIYVVPADKKPHVKRLKDALKSADRLLLATDEDREGESISWHVLQLLKPKKSVAVERIVFHEVTPEAIASALSSPRPVDENLVRAQEARRILDRLYGYSLSPLLWKRIRPGLSAGRVQSVAVRLLVEKERERIAFVSASYWDIKAVLATSEGSFKAHLTRVAGQRVVDSKSFDPNTGKLVRERRYLDEATARQLATTAQENTWSVASLERVPGKQRPAPPFITSTLQQEGNRKLRFTSRRTMSLAQQLYEGIDLGGERVGLITYMRTDSLSLASRAVEQARQVITSAYGSDYLPPEPLQYKTKAKNAQEAHEAIRPTDLSRRPQDVKPFLDADQFRLYELIWKRTIACQMVPARFERTAVEIEVDGGEQLTFAANGRRIVFPGFLRAYVEGSDDPEAQLGDQETLLPALEQGQQVEAREIEAEGHQTKPPYRYTEASLVKKLEEEGIGRPSTYASIISTIQDRGYAEKRGNELVPSFTAFCVTSLLEQQFADLVETRFTALMEDELDSVAGGRLAWDTLVSDFYNGRDADPGLSKRVEEGEVTYPAIPLGSDPETGEEISIKVGRYGPYIRRGEGGKENVATIPEGTAPDELNLEIALGMLRAKNSEDEPIVIDQVTGRPVTLKSGRFGEYLELGQTEAEIEAKEKPRRVSLPRGLKSAELTPEIAHKLIQLPRSLGEHPDNGDPITTGLGRYGPFLKRADEYRNLESWEKACDITREEALTILAQPKPERKRFGAKKTVLKELGEIEGAVNKVQVLDGRSGPYITDGKTNVTVPKGTDPLSVTPEQAKDLLDAKRKAPKKPRRRRRKS
ncbi:MAG: type I DNA topoisomerase [Acidobacteriota bacterium]